MYNKKVWFIRLCPKTLSKPNLRLVEGKGAIPFIEFKTNSIVDKKCDIWTKMFHYYSLNKDEFMQHYHKRSNVETTFSMVKAKFGGAIRSKLPIAQANEILCKILCHNICCLIQSIYELEIEVDFEAMLMDELNVHQEEFLVEI